MDKKLSSAQGHTPHCKRTPPMIVNEIARLFHTRMRGYDLEGVMSQDSARLIMRELAHGEGCSQLDLVRKTHLKAPTVSVTLRRMESEGLVERHQDAMDMRVTRVYLSQKGKAHHATVLNRLHAIDTALMQGFDEEETVQLLHFLERMRDNILPADETDHSAESNEK